MPQCSETPVTFQYRHLVTQVIFCLLSRDAKHIWTELCMCASAQGGQGYMLFTLFETESITGPGITM